MSGKIHFKGGQRSLRTNLQKHNQTITSRKLPEPEIQKIKINLPQQIERTSLVDSQKSQR